VKKRPVDLNLPPLDGPTAAWLIELCGQLQAALWREYGDEIDAHWRATVPAQPIYGTLQDSRPPPKKR
jgi:hypothetical protein